MKHLFIGDDGFAVTKKQKKVINKNLVVEVEHPPLNLYTYEELLEVPKGSAFIFDIESYVNYFLIAFENVETGKVIIFEDSPDASIDLQFLRWVLNSFLFISFNGIRFDLVLVAVCLLGFNCVELKKVTNRLIAKNDKGQPLERPKEILNEYGTWLPTINHIDLIEVCPLEGSLKKYAGRLHAKRMQELPYEPESILTKRQSINVLHYCINDLVNTKLLFVNLKEQLALRERLGEKYGIDLRSKSDAQIAEAVITQEYTKKTGKRSKSEKVNAGSFFKYEKPDYLVFQTDLMKDVLRKVEALEFEISETGYVVTKDLSEIEIAIGTTVYKMGKGGLHSKEKSVSYVSNDEYKLEDDDVESYYPRLILNSELFPKNMGSVFAEIYLDLVESRIADKKAGNSADSDSKKIVINGTFGKLGNKWSAMYSPNLLIQVTVTGQLLLLMLIELFEISGIKVVSANTDGVVTYVGKNQHELKNAIVKYWEELTSLKTERTNYLALYSRDINNYVAVKIPDKNGDIKIKGKGSYFDPRYDPKTAIFRFHKSPQTVICLNAIANLLCKNIPIEETIYACTDITKFVSVREVKGGAEQYGEYLGKVVRFYYSTESKSTINYIISGNIVPKSDGAKPLLELPNSLPLDINYKWYIEETISMLKNIDYLKTSKIESLFD